MSNFNFNDVESEMYWDDQAQTAPNQCFGYEYALPSMSSNIFMESSTRPTEMVETSRFFFADLTPAQPKTVEPVNIEKLPQPQEIKKPEEPKEEVKEELKQEVVSPTLSEPEDAPRRKVNRFSTLADAESLESEGNQRDIKKRWNRQKDKVLFQVIRSLEADGKVTFEELISMNAGRDACSHPGVSLLAKKFGWKSLKKYLVLRIQSLSKRDFSVRETKALKRILKRDYEYKDLDYGKIIYEFPGKSVQRLKEVCDEIIQRRFQKTLTNYCLKQR